MFVMVIINVIVFSPRWKKTRNKVNRLLDMDEDIWRVQKKYRDAKTHTSRTFSDDTGVMIELKVSTY